ncbi:uncharacterized protein K489DRAFT_378704 [Dissoconium aciculare CBS 342.82]|uniref:Uncharacterized protein n=1 Tax=Dissoconium aciculare CBS 342.82 TaxID=1314786 RepID=A0A6J3MBR7_9PEZI|nr:uncharacterized protein K489DRAFT_378704 [Dissoconium aciculare CBS 342.82]KAF1824282.1 hypothetical protein K489DRAFT_378704 [Dissoconium aciculare CBS 342.82]
MPMCCDVMPNHGTRSSMRRSRRSNENVVPRLTTLQYRLLPESAHFFYHMVAVLVLCATTRLLASEQ